MHHRVGGVCRERAPTAHLTVRAKNELFASTRNPELLIDPVVFDGIGQVVGLWAAALGVSVLPSGVDKIEIYRPTPPPESQIFLRVWVSEVDTRKRLIKSQLEAPGRTWPGLVPCRRVERLALSLPPENARFPP